MESVLINDKYSVRKILTENKRNSENLDFFNYIKGLDLIKNLQEMLILSDSHYFYYNDDELKNIKLIMNARKMNDIEMLNDFMSALLENMSEGSYFCGCFINNKFSFSSTNKLGLLLTGFKLITDYPIKRRLLSISNIYDLFTFEIIKIKNYKYSKYDI